MILTLIFRLKDKRRTWLNGQARKVNFVFNGCNELSQKNLTRETRSVNQFELRKHTDGASQECGLHSHTIQAGGKEYAPARCSSSAAGSRGVSPAERTALLLGSFL